MGLIDFIVNASEAWSGPYSNFSCRSRTLEGFKRCYDYVSGNTHYYDNGTDYKSYSNTDKIISPTKTITKVYETEFIRYYKKRMKRLRLWENITSFISRAGVLGLMLSALCVVIFFNTISFIVIGAVLSATIVSLIVWPKLTDKILIESDSVLDVWLKQHREFK